MHMCPCFSIWQDIWYYLNWFSNMWLIECYQNYFIFLFQSWNTDGGKVTIESMEKSCITCFSVYSFHHNMFVTLQPELYLFVCVLVPWQSVPQLHRPDRVSLHVALLLSAHLLRRNAHHRQRDHSERHGSHRQDFRQGANPTLHNTWALFWTLLLVNQLSIIKVVLWPEKVTTLPQLYINNKLHFYWL